MTVVVFIGPTIAKADVLSVVDAVCLPPAAQGDVYRTMRLNPTYIGIIDGYFDGVAAVWHKEILWAISQGVKVFGASSMGALRAAELADFGMTGVGEIFQGFYSGALEDDDEVAVIHGPAELGYPALCEPMVNIRATVSQAVNDKVLLPEKAESVVDAAKSMHYRNRTWEALTAEVELDTLFQDWLKQGKVNQKYIDALAMLQAIQNSIDDGEQSDDWVIGFEFERTNQWVRATAQWDCEPDINFLKSNLVLDELRLMPDAFAIARDAAKLRFSVIAGSQNKGAEISNEVLSQKVNSLRVEHGLLSGARFNLWLADNELTSDELKRLCAEEIFVKDSVDLSSTDFQYHLLGYLKLAGEFQTLLNRAENKRKLLEIHGKPDPGEQLFGLSKPVLLEWYFSQRESRAIPNCLDKYAVELGLSGRTEFYQLLAREYIFLQSGGEQE